MDGSFRGKEPSSDSWIRSPNTAELSHSTVMYDPPPIAPDIYAALISLVNIAGQGLDSGHGLPMLLQAIMCP